MGLIEAALPRHGSQNRWFKRLAPRVIQFVLAALGALCLVDPLVSGTANFEIAAPSLLPTTSENLRVKVTPIGLAGPAGGDRVVVARFDGHAIAVPVVTFDLFEVSARIEVFDVTQYEQPPVAQRIVYVSPFARRQLFTTGVQF